MRRIRPLGSVSPAASPFRAPRSKLTIQRPPSPSFLSVSLAIVDLPDARVPDTGSSDQRANAQQHRDRADVQEAQRAKNQAGEVKGKRKDDENSNEETSKQQLPSGSGTTPTQTGDDFETARFAPQLAIDVESFSTHNQHNDKTSVQDDEEVEDGLHTPLHIAAGDLSVSVSCFRCLCFSPCVCV